MQEIKSGQIVKFHSPYFDEDPNDHYLVLEVFEDGERTRAKIQALETRFTFPSVSVVLAKDLKIEHILSKQLDSYLKTMIVF
ncbi:MAG TPA: hypothetical protein EYN07_02320 [Flavobacteriaceae bacterium]|nr:hypothetical protein [Flavobacteriaceae bacterium]HIN98056.1 hypothetical protein [Flavobacteriaceae bacterium]